MSEKEIDKTDGLTEKDEAYRSAMMADVPTDLLHQIGRLPAKSINDLMFLTCQLSLSKCSQGATCLPGYRGYLLDCLNSMANPRFAGLFERLEEDQLAAIQDFLLSLHPPVQAETDDLETPHKKTVFESVKKFFREEFSGVV